MDKTNNGGALTFADRIFDLHKFADLQTENICRFADCRYLQIENI